MSIEQHKITTLQHIQSVVENLNKFIHHLLKRGELHDASKLESPEAEIFGEAPDLKDIDYGSEEYKKSLEQLKPALDHHYSKNRHHPEFFKNGIEDMNLIDIIEMFCDWKSSTERNKNGNLRKSIEKNASKHNINPQLVKIFENTVELFDN